jgi:hypothetical protein
MLAGFVRRNYESILTAAFLVHFSIEFLILILKYGFGYDEDLQSLDRIILALTPAYFLALGTLYVLIFARRLRDEYVDKLWQQAARSFAILIMIAPWLWIAAWTIRGIFIPDVHWLPSDPMQPLVNSRAADPGNIAQHQIEGMDFLAGLLWTWSPPVFVILYKWHAWRDRT